MDPEAQTIVDLTKKRSFEAAFAPAIQLIKSDFVDNYWSKVASVYSWIRNTGSLLPQFCYFAKLMSQHLLPTTST